MLSISVLEDLRRQLPRPSHPRPARRRQSTWRNVPHRTADAMAELFVGQGPRRAITLQTNRFLQARHGNAILKEVFAQVDRCRLGKRFYRYPSRYRTDGFLVREGKGGLLHWHGILRLPLDPRSQRPDYLTPVLVKAFFRQKLRSGSVLIEHLHNPYRWSRYCLKSTRFEDEDNFLVSEAWSPRRAAD